MSMEKKYLIKEVGTERLMLTALTLKDAQVKLKMIQDRFVEHSYYVSKRGK